MEIVDRQYDLGRVADVAMDLYASACVLNRLDALVNPSFTIPQQKVHGPVEPTVRGRPGLPGSGQTPVLGVPELNVPAGFNRRAYEPRFVLSADKKRYEEVTGTTESLLPHPMPISIAFWGGPGDEPMLLKVASAYEAATKHRAPPPSFGPLRSEVSAPR